MGKIKLLDKTWFRVSLSIFIAYIFLLAVSLGEQEFKKQPICSNQNSILQRISRQALSLISLDHIESFSILVAASLYVLESRERRQKSVYEAWQVIDSIPTPDVQNSYARIQALENLNSWGISLKGLYLEAANLEGINLVKSDLRNTNLQFTNLSNAKLSNANFSNANLHGANLNNADISGANFVGAKSLRPDLIKSAKDWQKAIYDNDLREKLGLT